MMQNFKKLSTYSLALIIITAVFFESFNIYMKAHAAALSFVCANSAAATSVASCSGSLEQTGDLLLVMAGATSGSTIPTLATGFTSITTLTNSGGNSSTQTGMRIGWCVVGSGSCPTAAGGSGTWTSATDVVMMVYRGQGSSPIGTNFGTQSGNNSATSVSFNADTLSVTDGSSWFAAFAIRNVAHANMATAPAGMTTRTSIPSGTPAAAGYDLNGPTASNWTTTSVTGFSSSAKYTSIVLELKASPNITAGSFGTQVSSLSTSTTANFTGGAFTFVRDVGSANITSIKVHNSGTVNAQANLANLILYYKQEAACESSFPTTGITQFNSTAGSFNASGDSTVTGTISQSTSQVCVYAKVDVGSGASNGDTIDFQVTNPSTDVLVSSGSVSPATAVAIAGTTTISSVITPTTDQLMRGGAYFNSGTEQPYYWAK